METTRPRSAASDLSLDSAIAEFLASERYYLRPSTCATYRSHLLAFSAAHREASARDLRPPLVRAHLGALLGAGKRYAARNRAIALRALARYLARELRIPRHGGSSLADLRLPPVPYGGRAPYRTEEVLRMWEIIGATPWRCRSLWSAVFWLLLGTGLRSGEARLLRRADVELSGGGPNAIGQVVVSGENSKSAAGARVVPLDPRADAALVGYLRGRLENGSSGSEPLFLSADGLGFSRDGWNAMHQRVRRAIGDAGGPAYQPHRLRNTWARDMLEAGVPETVIVQLAGWADGDMLRRYVGRLSIRALKGYPTTLAKYATRRRVRDGGVLFGRGLDRGFRGGIMV